MNVRLFILAAISFGCGLVFQYTNVIQFDDYYASSSEELSHRRNQLYMQFLTIRGVINPDETDTWKSMSDGRMKALTITYALGGISLIGGILITGLNKQKT